MPAIKHIHTYVKYKSKPNWYRCSAPNCTHHIDKEVLLGKLSLCTSCGAEMILTREDLRRVRPKCLNCSNTKKAKLHQKVANVMDMAYLGTEHFDPLKILQDNQGALFTQASSQASESSESEESEFDEYDEDDFDPEEESDSEEEEESEDSET